MAQICTDISTTGNCINTNIASLINTTVSGATVTEINTLLTVNGSSTSNSLVLAIEAGEDVTVAIENVIQSSGTQIAMALIPVLSGETVPIFDSSLNTYINSNLITTSNASFLNALISAASYTNQPTYINDLNTALCASINDNKTNCLYETIQNIAGAMTVAYCQLFSAPSVSSGNQLLFPAFNNNPPNAMPSFVTLGTVGTGSAKYNTFAVPAGQYTISLSLNIPSIILSLAATLSINSTQFGTLASRYLPISISLVAGAVTATVECTFVCTSSTTFWFVLNESATITQGNLSIIQS